MQTQTSLLERIGRSALDLVFPPRCFGCGADSTFLCANCSGTLERARAPRCDRCWRPGIIGTCVVCQLEPPAFDGLRAAFVYTGLSRELVQAFKYRGLTALAEPMAALCADSLRAAALDVDMIVPVPLSGLRKRTRGYNQAELLAKLAGRELGIDVAPKGLERLRNTPPQARSAGAESRRRNVAGAFRARNEVSGRRVLLIDDVTTTGATLAACAGALKLAGSRSVWAFAFGRED